MAEKQKKDDEIIPGMDLSHDYSIKKPIIPSQTGPAAKEMDKTKKELEKIKSFILKKFKFTGAISILPPQSLKFVIEEEIGEEGKEIQKEEFEKLVNKIHMLVLVPEEKLKEIPKIKKEIVEEIEKTKQNIWLHVKTPVDVWEYGLDSKFEIVSAIAMSLPLYDKGILSSLRVAEIHKALVLQKFEKYVVSYVIAGSLVRGDVMKDSDVDCFVIINDTDVKRMPRLELKERLRGLIYKYISEATALAGVKKNILNVQIYLLTEFWEAVKDANPVMFTFIRDGIPIYDRGTFMPWKALLKMGKLKPSPESIDAFMSSGDGTIKRAKRTLLDIFVHDIYWGIITPAQALVMLYGLPPPTPKQVVSEMNKVFVEKEKMLEKKYINTLEKAVRIYKDFEHEKLKEISGAEIDKLLKDMEDYLKRLKELRNQIEKRASEKTVEQIYQDVFELLKAIMGRKSQEALINEFEKEYVKKGKFTTNHLNILRDIVKARTEFKKGKLDAHKVNDARKNASILINELIEYSQRKEMTGVEKSRMEVEYKIGNTNKKAELIVTNEATFLFIGNVIKKLTNKIEKSNMEEVNQFLSKQKGKEKIELNPKVFELLEKELGNYKISM